MVNFNFKNLHYWLFHSQVRHLYVETMEVDALNTLIDRLRKSTFANFVYANWVRHRAELVELSEKIVEVDICFRVCHKSRPVRPTW
jgi:hypothetical protein